MKELARLARLIIPLWRWVLLGVALSLAALLANMALLALSSWFIASMAIAGSVGAVMEYSLPSTAIRALALARAGGRYAERLVNHGTTFRILSTLRVWFFERIEPLAPAGLAAYRSGDLLSRIRADIDTLDDFYVRGVIPSIVAVLGAACIVLFLAGFDPRLACIDAAALAAAGAAIPLLLRRLGKRAGRERVARASDLRASVVEGVQGMAELIALGAAEEHERRIAATGRAMDRRQRRLASLQGAGEAGLVAASSLAVWGAALVLAPLVAGGAIPRAHMAMLTVFVLASFEAITPLPAVIQKGGEMAAAARRLFEITDSRPGVSEPGAPAPLPPAAPTLGLSFRGLRFRYSAGQPWVFDGFSLEVPPGGRVALVGPTGAGKSTLVGLLLRFWEYEGGHIAVVDETGHASDLRGFAGDAARRLFSVVPQAPYLFHASIRENLLLAAPGAQEGVLWSALAAAQLDQFFSRLPGGLDTLVGETGSELSAGEVKRVAVARALLKDAPFLLLDEPTEGLDDTTADALLDAVGERLGPRTLLIITHRERDLRIADAVVRLAAAAG